MVLDSELNIFVYKRFWRPRI